MTSVLRRHHPSPIHQPSAIVDIASCTMFASRFAARNVLRLSAQRRLASSGTAQNAFIKERQDIKEHAKQTTDLWKKISI
ncbi:hypothetical protein CDD82_7280 [Ophiocordyceps australis]|uniref:Uncharacterized protein n=1 Tax=Ophiocordyceps australis TaxID=1399860 RepID=A0A2C5ZRH3_9HYPO|nr:hypothetical protein CDD82_7280 [Ophiocordyceps australis]